LHGNRAGPGSNLLGGAGYNNVDPGHRFSTVLTEGDLNRPGVSGGVPLNNLLEGNLMGRNSLGGFTGGNDLGGGLMGRNSLGAPLGGGLGGGLGSGLLGNNDRLLRK